MRVSERGNSDSINMMELHERDGGTECEKNSCDFKGHIMINVDFKKSCTKKEERTYDQTKNV
jgi:hypothetical protein